MSLLLLFNQPSGPANYKLTCQAGQYNVTGQQATISRNRSLTAQSGSYALNGQQATLTKAAAGAYTLTCLSGSYVISGQSATLTRTGGEQITLNGAASRSRVARRRVVVDVDGKEYVVPIEDLQEFLNAISEKTERVAKAPKKRKAREQKKIDIQEVYAPEIKIISVPFEEIALIQRNIDRTNEIMRQVFEGAIRRYLQDLEDEEECLLMLL